MKNTKVEDREYEIWKDVKGYRGLYKVSSLGRVLSFYKNDYLSLYKNSQGYLCLNLYKDGNRKNFKISRLVALHFIPNPDNKPEVNHLYGNKLNNYYKDLEWCTSEDNIEHAFENGLHNNPRKPVYSPELNKTFRSAKDVQRELNICSCSISRCCNGIYKYSGIHTETRKKLTWQYV